MVKKSTSSKASQQNAKVAIITALITAVSTIAVAFIGIVPHLRQDDAKKIEDMNAELSSLKQSVTEMRVLSQEGGTSRGQNTDTQAAQIQLELLQTDAKIPQDQYFNKGKEALNRSGFTGIGINDQVIYGFDREYTGLVWGLSSNLVIFVVSGPDWQTASKKVENLKRGF